MNEKLILRGILYAVFGYSLLAAAANDMMDTGRAIYFVFIALFAFIGLTCSAYDPRYSPWIQPPAKRPRED